MTLKDTYREITSPTTEIYKEKRSKFIAYSYPVYCKKDIKEIIEQVKKIEPKARHYCYAYVLYSDKSAQKTNDDGEPSYTAGKPILRQILSHNLTNILIIVVRYFGGIKLGSSGLIRSYKTAAEKAIVSAEIITKNITEQYQVSFPYSQINNVMRIIKEFDLKIVNTDFKLECKLIFKVTKNNSAKIVNVLEQNHKLTIKHLQTT